MADSDNRHRSENPNILPRLPRLLFAFRVVTASFHFGIGVARFVFSRLALKSFGGNQSDQYGGDRSTNAGAQHNEIAAIELEQTSLIARLHRLRRRARD